MSLLGHIANGLGTLLGVLVDTTTQVIASIKSSYHAYRKRGGATKDVAAEAAEKTKERLREVNDEIMDLRNRCMGGGSLSVTERRRWGELRGEREALLADMNQAKEVRAAEKILDAEEHIQKVDVDLETRHVLQYNAFADLLGKHCPKPNCGRQMKLQWRLDLSVVELKDFFWGCTGWYFPQGDGRACTYTEKLQRNDYGLMTDTSEPEFSMTAEELEFILSEPSNEKQIVTRLGDLKSDLDRGHKGVELATCPVHGENMVLRRKDGAASLLDAYFLGCPHWKPSNRGCAFIEKLKSGPQLAALLKSQTGRGILGWLRVLA